MNLTENLAGCPQQVFRQGGGEFLGVGAILSQLISSERIGTKRSGEPRLSLAAFQLRFAPE